MEYLYPLRYCPPIRLQTILMPPAVEKAPKKEKVPFTLIIDTREQTPLYFSAGVPTVRKGLHTGDYSIVGFEDEFTIERKSADDLVNTLIHDRERFGKEMKRMQSFQFRRVVCTSSLETIRQGFYHSRANPNAVLALVQTFEIEYNVPFVFASSPDEAARYVEGWARYYVRFQMKKAHGNLLAQQVKTSPIEPPPAIGSFEGVRCLYPSRDDAANNPIPTPVVTGCHKV